jgi:diacylglycerol kinase family enzyme
MAIPKQVHIIYNPKSTGDSLLTARRLKRELKGYDVTLLPTEYAGHAELLAYELACTHKAPLIVSSSGDGGYNEVVNGVIRSGSRRAVCAVLSAGNANDHARTMHSAPLDTLIRRGRVRRLDLLALTVGDQTRYAHSYIGLGITPVIAAELNKHDLTAFKEMKIVFQRFYRYRPFKIRRGSKVIRLNSLIFANINQMAKVLTLAPMNTPSDGKFEVILFPAQAKRRLLFGLLRAAVSHLPTTRHEVSYRFQVLKAMPVQLDGEVMKLPTDSTVHIQIVPRRLRTLY